MYRLYRPFCPLTFKKSSTLFWSVQTVQIFLPSGISKRVNYNLKWTDCSECFAFCDFKLNVSTIVWTVQTVQSILPSKISKKLTFSDLKKAQLYFKVYRLFRSFCPLRSKKKLNSTLKCTDCTEHSAFWDLKKVQLYFEVYRLSRAFCLLRSHKAHLYFEVYRVINK